MANANQSPAHTAGPWKIAGESSNDGEAFILESEERTIGWTANTLNPDGSQVITKEDEANARLAAAGGAC